MLPALFPLFYMENLSSRHKVLPNKMESNFESVESTRDRLDSLPKVALWQQVPIRVSGMPHLAEM